MPRRRIIVEFFEKAFHWLAGVSEKLPVVDTKLFFIVVLSVILGIGVIIAFTLLGSRARKLYVSSKKIRKYLANIDAVDDDNVSDFTAHCFSKKTPQPLRDAWVQYLGVRFGYPSDIVSDSAVYDKFVKKNKDVRSGVFAAISLILLGLFAFWGYGTLKGSGMGVVHLAALVLIGVIYLVLAILAKKQNQRCLETFEAMQEDLDAKVNLQIESNYATDSSPLQELNSLVEEIIARNTAKAVDIDDNEQTPIEALIEQKMKEQSSDDEQESIDEILQVQEEEAEHTAQEESEETESATENVDEDATEQQHIDELLQAQQEEVEQTVGQEEEETEDSLDEQSEQPEEVQNEDVLEQEVEQTEEEVQSEVEEPAEQETLVEEPSAEEETSEEESNEEESAEEENEAEASDDEAEDVAQPQQDEQEQEEPCEEGNQSDPEDNETVAENSVDETEESAETEESGETEESAETEESGETEEGEALQNVDEQSEETEEAQEDSEPEVVYVVDGDEDDEEQVKPAKLVKLPNLVDYMLSKSMPKAMKIQIATMLISTYNKFKDSKEDRKIVVSCLAKVMRDLQTNN